MLAQILFIIIFGTAIFFFARAVKRIRRNILLGKPEDRSDNPAARWVNMAKVALGQSKMTVKPIAGFFHILIYVGFVLINIEVLEILIDGVFGTHRFFAPYLGSLYIAAINFFEILALLVVVACIVFLWRRNVQKIERFKKIELQGFPTIDANVILVIEIVLMGALLTMNAAEANFDNHTMGSFVISGFIAPFLNGFSQPTLHVIERSAWWFHIIGIFAFLNYLPYSKHFHVIMAFPNTWYADLEPMGKIKNMESVTNEVKLMLDPNANPYASAPSTDVPARFGAKDVQDLTWKNIMDAYSCTECGRCTSACPQNMTGKKLSPRKIMMDTRDRVEEVGKNIDKNGKFVEDGKSLLGDYITHEEIRACNTCNACVEACPVNINPLSIILELRRYSAMEESNIPTEWAGMQNNMENNGAPWQFPAADRGNWVFDVKRNAD